MPLTLPTPPTAPSLADPTNFDTRTDAFLAWMSTLATTWNSTPPYISGDSPTFAATTVTGAFTSLGIDDNAASTAITIDASGNVLVGTTVTAGTITTVAGANYYSIYTAGSSAGYNIVCRGDGTTGVALRFLNSAGSDVGSIDYTASATSYTTSSDYRLKENITPVQGAADIVKAMQPVTYTFKSDGSWHDGFLAHELQELHPRAVTGSKDAMKDEEYEVTPAVLDEDGAVVTEAVMGTRSVPEYQGVDYSKFTPIITAALQEALNKIDDLEAKNAAFETRLAALAAV